MQVRKRGLKVKTKYVLLASTLPIYFVAFLASYNCNLSVFNALLSMWLTIWAHNIWTMAMETDWEPKSE